MTEPDPAGEVLNPVQVERRIREISNDIGRSVRASSDAYKAFKSAEAAYRTAYATAYLNASDHPAHARRYVADLATMDEKDELDVADVAWRYAKSRADALESELRAMQSVGASVRQAYGAAGRGEGA